MALALDLLRRADKAAWNALLITRREYESRCALMLKRNSPGWLDRKLADRATSSDGPMQRCAALRSPSPVKVLWTRGGTPTERIRISECVGYEARDPYRLIVETANRRRTSVRIDLVFDAQHRRYVPTGYVECYPADVADLACYRLRRFLKADPRNQNLVFSVYGCTQRLKKEPRARALGAIGCLEGAATLPAARRCWGDRPLE